MESNIKEKRPVPRPAIEHSLKNVIRTKDKDNHQHIQQLRQVYRYLFNHPSTMKETDKATGIMRENVCRHIATLRKNDSLYVMCRRPCHITKHVATVFTTNPVLVPKPDANQLKMF